MGTGTKIVVVVLIVGAIAAYHDSNRPGIDLAPSGQPSAAASDPGWLADVVAVRAIRTAMKNPASFDLTSATRTQDGALCVTYRARNSFNAIVPSQAVVASGQLFIATNGGDVLDAWATHCAGRRGEDISHIRRAL